MSNASDFVIENGVLEKYTGSGGDVVIPEGVTSIGDSVFDRCKNLKSIVIPNGVTSIDDEAFSNCSNLTSIVIPDGVTMLGRSAFSGCKKLESIVIPSGVTSIGDRAFSWCEKLESIVIPNGVTSIDDRTFYWCGKLESIVIPEGVTSIGGSAFSGCKNLTSIVIPDSVTSIGDEAFSGCKKLKKFGPLSPSCKMGKDVFGKEIPKGIYGEVCELLPFFTDAQLKTCVLNERVWKELAPELKVEIFLTRQGKPLLDVYKSITSKPDAALIGEMLVKVLSAKPGAKECTAAANFMTLFCIIAEPELLKTLYSKLKELKVAGKAVKTVEEHAILMKKLGCGVSSDENLPEAEKRVARTLMEREQTEKDLEKTLKGLYSLTFPELPELCGANGKALAPSVLAYLLTLHEELEEHKWSQSDVVPAYEKAGLCPEAQELLALLDGGSLQKALVELADRNLGLSGRSKKMFLAYPICRYADEGTMAELTARAPKWRSSVSGNDAPPLATFRKANAYSDTRAAMLFADKYHELEAYADIRGTTEDAIRDRFLSDVGVDENGRKSYDLGNQTVTAVLQGDLSFLIELPDGKIAKSLPKKGADEAKYEAANADFSEMKKAVKRITKNRGTVLFEDFLSGRTRKADEWKDAYLVNPVLRMTAKLLVWAQGKKTFTLAADGAITSDGSAYEIADGPIKLAHPMEMPAEDVTAWQKYFTSHALKQPFEQVWEPAIDGASVAKDRYKDCPIPFLFFRGKEKHGITVQDYDYHNEIYIYFDGIKTSVERLDFRRHAIENGDRFEVKTFSFEKYNRKVNHIVAYLDRITVYNRIKNDDVSVERFLSQFTLAQITEFIKIAQENNATNVAALLLEYKNANFADFDPMDDFSLEW